MAASRPAANNSFVLEPLTNPFADDSMSTTGLGRQLPVQNSNAPVDPPNKNRKWYIIGALVVLVIVIIAVAVGVTVHKNKSKKEESNPEANYAYTNHTAMVVKSDPADPSKFSKDGRLHKVLYGVAYSPLNVLEPQCGAVQANVTEDIQLISQLSSRIRTYGSACNQTQLLLQAIVDTKTDIDTYLGVYIGTNETVNLEQMQHIIEALDIYGVDHVSGVTVGNEYILGQVDKAAATDFLIEKIAQFRQMIASKPYASQLKVGTADAGSIITVKLAEASDFVMANVHPFFAGLPVEQSAGWTWEFFERNDVSVGRQASNNPEMIIAETGWPSDSMTEADRAVNASVAGIPQLQTFLDTYICTANTNNSAYFYFEVFDEPWKEQYGGVEPHWGLFDYNKILKPITIPSCA